MEFLDQDEPVLRPLGLHEPPKSRFPLRQLVLVLLVLVLGGAFGTGAYFLSDVDTRDLIGLLDIGDKGPLLSLQMPAKSGDGGLVPAPPGEGGAAPAITPPAPATSAKPSPGSPASAPAAPSAAPSALSQIPPTAAAPAPEAAAPATSASPTPVVRPVDKPPAYADLPSVVNHAAPLAAAPVKELLADSAAGPLPVVGVDGRQPWRVYARPAAPLATGKPRLAVVVTGLGLDRAATEAAIGRLPPEVSLAFSPYAPDLPKWIAKAREAGHEALIMLPASSDPAADDPGPLGLRATATAEDNTARLEALLAKAPGVIGVAVAPGGFGDSPQLAPVLADLLRRGLLYVGGGVRGARVPPAAAVTQVADQDPWRDAIDARLSTAVGVAQAGAASGDGAVLMTSARPVSLERLAAFLAGLDGRGVALVPASALAKAPGSK